MYKKQNVTRERHDRLELNVFGGVYDFFLSSR